MARTPAAKTAATKPAKTKTVSSKAASTGAVTARRAGSKAAGSRPRAVAAIPDVLAPQAAPSASRPAIPVIRRRRSNRRSEQTIEKILSCTEKIILETGAERVSILNVCREADVSRGTFYRYFASQDELLDAFSRHKRERFHHALKEMVAPLNDPDARFAAIIDYLDHYLQHGNARRLLIVAPEYAMGFFRRIFHDSIVRFQDALGIVFDAWEERLAIQLDRELIAEMLIRYVLSEQLVPSDSDRKSLPRRIGRMVDAMVLSAPLRARR